MFKELLSSSWHHAYVVEGSVETTVEALLDFFRSKTAIGVSANPDVMVKHYESFGIDDARELSAMQTTKSVGAGKRLFIIGADVLTTEAQQSLLKTFEEPTSNTFFFLVIESARSLLPTLLSRIVLLSGIKGEIWDEKRIETFIKAASGERLKAVADIVSKKEKKDAVIFLNSLEKWFSNESVIQKDGKAIEEILQAKRFLALNGASVKMIIEHIALVV